MQGARVGDAPTPGTAERLVPCAFRLENGVGRPDAPTVISFSVSVPVLSVQMTVVSPSVSTDESRRTSAFRFAMRCVATASDERHGREEPLGDVGDHDADGEDEAVPGPSRGVPRRRRTASRFRREAATSAWFGRAPVPAGSDRAVCSGELAMRPNRVCHPGRDTTASPDPGSDVVPASTEPSGSTGYDSPVSVDLSTEALSLDADLRRPRRDRRGPAAARRRERPPAVDLGRDSVAADAYTRGISFRSAETACSARTPGRRRRSR